jgi:hypothetical protein
MTWVGLAELEEGLGLLSHGEVRNSRISNQIANRATFSQNQSHLVIT